MQTQSGAVEGGSSRNRGTLFAMAGNGRAAVFQTAGLATIQVAKQWVQSGCGLEDPSLMADDFKFLDPLRGTQNKKAYLAALEKLDLQSAFPDLDLRAHDFRVDRDDPTKVWFTTRVLGTHKYPLTLGGEEIAPTGIKMQLPPESNCVNIVGGKVVRAVGGGIVLDRSVGNSRGLGGVYGVAAALGRPVSAFKHTPPQKVFQDFFGRTFKPSTEAPPVFSPLPEAVMVGLAKGLLASDFGAADPGLLAKDFKFVGPLVGPLPRDTFVKAFSSFNLKRAFPDINNEAYDFRVDPYDPARVWFTVKSQGTFTGAFGEGRNSLPPNGGKYRSGPEGISVTFNGQGQCVKLTVGVLMDPEEGDTGGLGGVFGVLFAVGTPLPPFVTRPLPQHLRHWKNYVIDVITSPFTASSSSDEPAAATAAAAKRAPEAPKAAAVVVASKPQVVAEAPKKTEAPPPPPPAAKVQTAKPVVAAKSKPTPAPVVKKGTPPPPPPPPVAKKPAPPAAPKVQVAPKPAATTTTTTTTTSSSSKSSNPFSSFFGGDAKKTAAPKPAAKPAAPAARATAGGKAPVSTFKGIPSKPSPKPVMKKATPPPSPAKKAAAPAPAAAAKAAEPLKPSGGGFSLFGGGNKKAEAKPAAKSSPPPPPAKVGPKPSIQSQSSRPKVTGMAKKK